jgi:sterol desaturase/sphingolipid hydroxylase (fatty acid hydroxylase superfamily)
MLARRVKKNSGIFQVQLRSPLLLSSHSNQLLHPFYSQHRMLTPLYNFFSSHGLLSDYHLWATMTWLWLTLLYWICSAYFAIFDFSLSPKSLAQYKFQTKGADILYMHSKYKQAVKWALFSQLTAGISVCYITAPLMLRRCPSFSSELPSFPVIIFQFIIVLLFEEVWFYFTHRLFHNNNFLWKNVHSIHHQFNAPIACAAVACHPIEHFIVNCLPLLLGACLAKMHFKVAIVWYSLAIINTTCTHSGYNLFSRNHDRHHENFKTNFGVLEIFDTLLHTSYSKYLKKTEKKL